MRYAITTVAILGLVACGDNAPRSGNVLGSFFPLAVGNRWVYVEKDNLGVAADMNDTKEITAQEELDGEQTYVMVSTPDGRPGVDPIVKRFNWLVTEERVDRVRAEDYFNDVLLEEHTYDPGFPRFINALQEVGDNFVLSVTHDCTPVNGTTCTGPVTSEYTWSVESVDAVITVPAGTFACLKIRRQRAFGNYKEFWYAGGVGKVYEWGDTNTEELLEYDVTE